MLATNQRSHNKSPHASGSRQRLSRVGLLLVTISLAGLSHNAAQAADSKGRFTAKGAGLATCEQFNSSVAEMDNGFHLFAGYVHGYLTAANRYSPKTFDLLPWQNDSALISSIARVCKQNPKTRFAEVVRQLTRLLDAQRLSESSEVAVIDGKPPISLYREVIFRIQTQLKARGLYDGEMTSEFDDATQTALRAFQKAASIPVTGVPGQESLRRLFYPGANSPAPKS